MGNHLSAENSPYLLQHANNPVDWYPWSPEAIEKARSEDRPIFLSIGYAACHWCHVMAHESFEDEDTAAFLNAHFVNIKVDREERPDLDGIYMQAVVAMTGQGGWPMSVFMTPDGVPFFGGTYFPPVRRYSMPAFREIIQTIARLWKTDRARLLEGGKQIALHLQHTPVLGDSSNRLDAGVLDSACDALAKSYDWKNGGWGPAPKFPQPMSIEFLLSRASTGDEVARKMADHALNSMAQGGMYDVIGGGFARYSTDASWLVPHFEKMLYDNALLALAYLHGWLVCRQPAFRRICEETLDFVLREMTHPLGGLYSSLDADSEGEEGRFYTWSYAELTAILPAADAEIFLAAYNVTPAGNFEGRIVLQRAAGDDQIASRFDIPADQVADRLAGMHRALLAERGKRVRPATDDKILASWNALMLAAYAEAARYLDREDYLAAARKNARFLLDNLFQNGRLLRSWRAGQSRHNAYLEDYAALALGLLSLYQSDPNPEWYTSALQLTNQILGHFKDPSGGFFDTADDHETLLVRPKDIQDNATPSGNALAAMLLLQMSVFEGNMEWRDEAESMLGSLEQGLSRYPAAFGQWLKSADFGLHPASEIALVGDFDHPAMAEFIQKLWSEYRPHQVLARSTGPSNRPALLQDRSSVNGMPTAYVCREFTCRQPTNSPDVMLQEINRTQSPG